MAYQRGNRKPLLSEGQEKPNNSATYVLKSLYTDGEDHRLREIQEALKRLKKLMLRTDALHSDILSDLRSYVTLCLNNQTGHSPSCNGNNCKQQLCCLFPQLQRSCLGARLANGQIIKTSKRWHNLTNQCNMAYFAFTDAPRNVKEGIDWLIALKGTDPENNIKAIGEAIHKFLADKPVGKMKIPALERIKCISKNFLQQESIKDCPLVNDMLRKFNKAWDKSAGKWLKRLFRIYESDYKNVIQSKGLTAETISNNLGKVVYACEEFLRGIKVPGQYRSAYSSEAMFYAACAKFPEACAVVVVGIAPMLYVGLQSLSDASVDAFLRWPPFTAYNRMQEVLKAVGYVEPGCRRGMKASHILSAFRGFNLRIFKNIYDFAGFWAFY
ncbi:hypothetical protein BBBOND_0100700 [Babesia bigemina]|uniref:Uncharacterized protein n=1 Tax=Babesia bigemina TaxID=5866 RepID=A0A061CYN0_BABBI|nr:hypothetical protein BBBOND_0100700 [Babesia bigemina]CDR93741.1 hypothetical protein BBBOND_0100700 [Babesia bigemina]|eukprot:XP_012765927.1 hypothetical protein BBBOND_0100700 [Babesia bigemina]